jgi:hypothetical protein
MRRKDEIERPYPNEDEIRTIIKDDMSHIHEDKMNFLETHSHVRSEVPTLHSGRDHKLNNILH